MAFDKPVKEYIKMETEQFEDFHPLTDDEDEESYSSDKDQNEQDPEVTDN